MSWDATSGNTNHRGRLNTSFRDASHSIPSPNIAGSRTRFHPIRAFCGVSHPQTTQNSNGQENISLRAAIEVKRFAAIKCFAFSFPLPIQ